MRFDFPNKNGETLSGKLELPASAPRAFALFAHCFTCSKDLIAAGVIAKTLAEKCPVNRTLKSEIVIDSPASKDLE